MIQQFQIEAIGRTETECADVLALTSARIIALLRMDGGGDADWECVEENVRFKKKQNRWQGRMILVRR